MNDLHSPALSDNLQKNMSKEENSALRSYEVEFAAKSPTNSKLWDSVFISDVGHTLEAWLKKFLRV